MKKFFSYLLIALPLVFITTACDDDDDKVPNVGVQCTISGGVFNDDVIYVEKGEQLKIDGLTLVNHTDRDAAFGAVSYYWDHYLIGTNPSAPLRVDHRYGRPATRQSPAAGTDAYLCGGLPDLLGLYTI